MFDVFTSDHKLHYVSLFITLEPIARQQPAKETGHDDTSPSCHPAYGMAMAMSPISRRDTTTGDRRRRVLLFPLPYQGHINPMFQLAGLLHSRGFAITVFHTDFNAPDASRHPAYDFVPVPDGTPESNPAQVTTERILELNRACEAPFRKRLAALLEQENARDNVVACLVGDAHLLTLLEVARGLGVPTMVLRTTSAACFRCFLAYPMLHQMGYLPPQGNFTKCDSFSPQKLQSKSLLTSYAVAF
jgi:hypothetical protein